MADIRSFSKFKKTSLHLDVLAKFTVISGSSSFKLAKKIAERLRADFVNTELRTFPDGEGKITLAKKPKKTKMIVVQSTYPPVDTNLVQLLSLISKAREYSTDVTAVVPYMGYARQDREFLSGEVVTMKVIAKLIKGAGATRILVVDIHSMIGLRHFKIRSQNITAIPDLVRHLKKIKLENPLVVSPDRGGKDRARRFADIMKTDYIVLDKRRDRKTGKVEIRSTSVDVSGRDLVLVDDMISTGGSIIKATEFLKKHGCRRVFVACTHALLMNQADKRILKAGVTKIISTNTIPGETSVVDVSRTIADTITNA